MKVWLTHEDLNKITYGLEHTLYAWGHDQKDVSGLINKLNKAKETN